MVKVNIDGRCAACRFDCDACCFFRKIDVFVFDRFAVCKPFYIIITTGMICVIVDIGTAVDPACAESLLLFYISALL